MLGATVQDEVSAVEDARLAAVEVALDCSAGSATGRGARRTARAHSPHPSTTTLTSTLWERFICLLRSSPGGISTTSMTAPRPGIMAAQ